MLLVRAEVCSQLGQRGDIVHASRLPNLIDDGKARFEPQNQMTDPLRCSPCAVARLQKRDVVSSQDVELVDMPVAIVRELAAAAAAEVVVVVVAAAEIVRAAVLHFAFAIAHCGCSAQWPVLPPAFASLPAAQPLAAFLALPS